MSNDLMCKDLEILKGRIWPAIQSCIDNRYKIVISFFAFYSFMMTSITIHYNCIKFYTSILFTFLTLLNSINYFLNSTEQWKKENRGKQDSWREWGKRNNIELPFLGIMMLLVWGAYFLIKDC